MMFDEIDDLRANLRESADGFRPHLDAGELARTGRRIQRRNRVLGGVAGAAALALAVGFGAPAILNLRTDRPAVPAGSPTNTPSPTAPASSDAFAQMSKPARMLAGDSWELLEAKDANLGVRVPPGWTVVEEGEDVIPGMIEIRAASGYVVAISTVDGLATCSERQPDWESLGEVSGLEAATRDGATGTAEIFWKNGGESAVWVGLALDRGPGGCFEQYLDFGNVVPVTVGALGGNAVNPTPEELDQAVAMLASVERLS